MVEAALGLWIVTAFGGLYLWTFTTDAGLDEPGSLPSDLPPSLLFLHPLLALTGLGLWIGHHFTRGDVLPWVAFADLLLTVLVGEVLLARTLRRSRAGRPRAEDRMPRPAIVVHGLLAGVTVLVVLLAALDLGS